MSNETSSADSSGSFKGRGSGNAEYAVPAGQTREFDRGTIVVRVESVASKRGSYFGRLLIPILISSLLMNFLLIASQQAGQMPAKVPEQFVSGDRTAKDRIAIINFSGTISPPFTERWLKQIQQAREDDTVKGVVLAIDSPGGLVADSHQLYHELQKLVEKKPVFAAMKRMAASGGYYIAMGIGQGGRIFAEPTTWTGSIGVIIPRYNATELAQNIGVKVEPLMTGELKDTLNPFRDLNPQEKEVWDAILNDSFERFVSVIADNRSDLDAEAVRKLATGQIYTCRQALENHLVDEVGYVEDAVTALSTQLQLTSHRAFEYRSAPSLFEVLMGAETHRPATFAEQLLDAAVPRAMYYCSWNPMVPTQEHR